MFCYKCGKKIDDEANFCPYCGAEMQGASQNQQMKQDNKENVSGKKKELTIMAVENAILKTEKAEDKIKLLKVAGDAYASGNFGAPQDYKKAIEKYKAATDLGSAECQHSLGTTYVMEAFDAEGEDADLLFSLGLTHVCWSYKKGYTPAKDTLQYFIDKGVFPNCNTVEDLLALSEIV